LACIQGNTSSPSTTATRSRGSPKFTRHLQHGAQARLQQRVEAMLRLLLLAQLRQRDRAFSQAFERQPVQRAAFSQRLRGVDAVPGVTAPLPMRSARVVMGDVRSLQALRTNS